MKLKPSKEFELICKLSSSPLIIYGMGYVGNLIADWCHRNGTTCVFCDRDAAQKRKETEQTVIFPEELTEAYLESAIVVASINYQDEIRSNLKKLGIADERILSYLAFWPERVDWDELEASVDWDNVHRRAEIFAAWIDPTAKLVADYSFERNFLKNFLGEDVQYLSPDYIRFQDNVPCADFSEIDPAFQADVSSCLAMLMSFRDPDMVIEYLCARTKKAIIASYVPLERMPDIQVRRSINYNSDYTELRLISAFETHGFRLTRYEQDPFDAVHTVYLFEKKEIAGSVGYDN